MIDEQKIRQIAEEVYNQKTGSGQFSSFRNPSHVHNGTDSPKINQGNIVPGIRASGSVTFKQSTLYQLGITFNPTSVWFYGLANNASGGGSPTIRAHCIGNAQLGNTFYFQPSTSTSTVIGGPEQNIIQSSTMFLVDDNAGAPLVRALVDEGNLVDVEYGGIKARATIVAYNNSTITIQVSVAAGWQIVGNYVVT